MKMWLYHKQLWLEARKIQWSDRMARFAAYAMPESWAYWAFIRIAIMNLKKDDPGDQKVSDVLKRYELRKTGL